MISLKVICNLPIQFMDKEQLQRNFKGFMDTPLLWKDKDIYDLQQCVLKASAALEFKEKIADNLLLGKLVERFVSYQLAADDCYEILGENIQIQDNKITIGEMDALVMTMDEPVHLEIIYKFYLYDPTIGTTELSHWIGPNRKDCLLQKLNKLKNKQLPLLYHPKTQSFLDHLNLDASEVKQQVLFKGQLFLPFGLKESPFMKLNSECLQGFYLKKEALGQFNTCQFHIPHKINWLMAAHENVTWTDHQEFQKDVFIWLDKKLSPLCWMKQNGNLHKFFIVWW